MSMEKERVHVNGTLVQQLHFTAKVHYPNRKDTDDPSQDAPESSM